MCAFDRNLYWNASGKPVLFGPMTFTQWQATGQDKESRVADPLFEDPAKGDFRLRPGSPASQVGFEPGTFSTVGPRPVGGEVMSVRFALNPPQPPPPASRETPPSAEG